MARIGINPSRGKTLDFSPARTTVAVLVYAPYQAGYFQHRLDVTRMTIESILTNTHEAYDLLEFDNGSCPEMVAYLQSLYEQGAIDYLLLSKQNIGKLNALRMIVTQPQERLWRIRMMTSFTCPVGWANILKSSIPSQCGRGDGFLYPQRGNELDKHHRFCRKIWLDRSARLLMPHKWEEEYIETAVAPGRSTRRSGWN